MMEYDDIGIKDVDDVLEVMKAGAYAGELYEYYGERIRGLLVAALDKEVHGQTWGGQEERVSGKGSAVSGVIGGGGSDD